MLRLPSIEPAMRVLLASGALTVLFGAGVVAGLYFYPQIFPIETNHDEPGNHDGEMNAAETAEEPAAEHGSEEEEHVALTKQAFANLQLVMGHVTRDDYWKSILVPAQVVEIPGRSNLSVSTPVAGIVSRLHVLPGESLRPGQPLFEIRLTDQSLTDAQLKLVTGLTRQEVIKSEIGRIAPLAEAGALPGTRKRELEYELKQLQAEQATLTQVLRGHGLPESFIQDLLEEKQLATTFTINAPDFVQEADVLAPDSTLAATGYSIEDVVVNPGRAVERGFDLCNITYHAELYIKGTTFAEDLPTLNRITENGWQIAVEEHDTHGGPSHQHALDSVELLRIDNRVDETTQTVHFYAILNNSVVREHQEDSQSFLQWRFRPGQRLHLRLPVERWQDQITLPAAAVVVDGPNAMVFAQHHDEDHYPNESLTTRGDDLRQQGAGQPQTMNVSAEVEVSAKQPVENGLVSDAPESEIFIELEPIPVRLLHRDNETVVVANDGQIRTDMNIALNNAQKLYLAMKMQAGGGGHHHHHDH